MMDDKELICLMRRASDEVFERDGWMSTDSPYVNRLADSSMGAALKVARTDAEKQLADLRAQVERLGAPVSDIEMDSLIKPQKVNDGSWLVYIHRSDLDKMIAARIAPPTDTKEAGR